MLGTVVKVRLLNYSLYKKNSVKFRTSSTPNTYTEIDIYE